MKRILFVVICILLAMGTVCAQTPEYRVYSFRGDVKVKKSDKSALWEPIQEDQELSSNDSLMVGDGCSVRIEVVGPHEVYSISGKGNKKVSAWMKKSRDDNALRIAQSMNTNLLSGKKERMEHSMKVLGAGSRGLGEENGLDYTVLAEQLMWIGNQACTNKKSPVIEGITFTRDDQEADECFFSFENNTDKDYHINILHINKRTRRASLCFVITPNVLPNACPVTPSGYCSCELNLTFPTSPDDVYVLVAFEQPYDSYALNNELQYLSVENAKNTSTDIRYTWQYEKIKYTWKYEQ